MGKNGVEIRNKRIKFLHLQILWKETESKVKRYCKWRIYYENYGNRTSNRLLSYNKTKVGDSENIGILLILSKSHKKEGRLAAYITPERLLRGYVRIIKKNDNDAAGSFRKKIKEKRCRYYF